VTGADARPGTEGPQRVDPAGLATSSSLTSDVYGPEKEAVGVLVTGIYLIGTPPLTGPAASW
jgi:hypothetical protein